MHYLDLTVCATHHMGKRARCNGALGLNMEALLITEMCKPGAEACGNFQQAMQLELSRQSFQNNTADKSQT